MAATKQEQIERLQRQLEQAEQTASDVALAHAAYVLGADLADQLTFATVDTDHDGPGATRWYVFRTPFAQSCIDDVAVSIDGRVRISARDYPAPVEAVRRRLQTDLLDRPDDCTCLSSEIDQQGDVVHWPSCYLAEGTA